MGEFLDYFRNKKNLANLLLLGILVLAIPLGVNLVRQQQVLKSRATASAIVFSGPNVKTINNKTVATKPEVTLEITAPGDSGTGVPPTGSCPTQEQVAQAGLDKNPGVKGEILKFSGWPANTPALQIANEWIKIAPQDSNAQQLKKDLETAAACKSANSGGLGNLLVGTVYAETATCSNGTKKVGESWPECHDCDEGLVTCIGQDDYKWDSKLNPSPNCKKSDGTACVSNLCGNGKKVGEKWPECHGCDEGIVTCNGGTDYGWQSVSNPSPNCGSSCGGSSQCSGSIKFSGSCSAKGIEVSWNVSNVYGTCNVFLQGGKESQTLNSNGVCGSGSVTLTTFKGGPITDDGIYMLVVSNGSPSCNNKSIGTLSIPCSGCNVGKPVGTVTKQQADCVIAKKPYVVDFYGKNGWCTKPEGYQAIVYDWYKNLQDTKEKADVASCFGAATQIVSFRVSEDLNDWSSAPITYTSPGPVKVPWTFKDSKPGTKTIFVQFYDKGDKQVGDRAQAYIELLGGEPTIAGCALSFEGQNVTFEINGTNFGSDKGTIASDSTPLDIKSWSPTQIKASFTNPPTGQSFPITVTNTFGQSVTGQCSAISQVSVGAKVFCSAPSNHDTDNVDLELAGVFKGGKLIKQKVKIDKDGVIQGLDQKLETGKQYKLSLKAPKSLRKTSGVFTAEDGVTTVPDFVLPVGDIFPADGGDSQINVFDHNELVRQWIISADATGRSGDFNLDGRVNSIDWACMRTSMKDNGGSGDDPEPVPGESAP